MRRLLPALLGISLVLFFGAIFFNRSKNASAAPATHLVISEVQIAGLGAGTSSNDFVELYNPTAVELSLDGMRLGKKTSGTSSASVVTFASDDMVPAHGFFLWCNTSLIGTLACDGSGSGTIANNNSLALIDGTLASGTVVDAVTFGTPGTTFGEGTSLTAPDGGTSVERKANSTSDSTSMDAGGADELAGNGEDTGDNVSDFVSRATPQPQNNQSSVEPSEISPTPTEVPNPSVSPTPTEEPSPSPSPSVEPSPTTNPTAILTPTPEPTPIVSPSISPVPPTPTPKVIVNTPHLTCTLNYRFIRFFNFRIPVPFVHCVRT